MAQAHSTSSLPINFSPKLLRVQGDALLKDYLALEKAIDLAWNSYVQKNKLTPPNVYQLRNQAFKLVDFPRTKSYDLFKTFYLLLRLSKHSAYKLDDDSKIYVVKMVRKAS